jgi:hypothetical protein
MKMSVRSILTEYPVTIGLLLRLGLAWLLPVLLDDGKLVPGVAYTDIDLWVPLTCFVRCFACLAAYRFPDPN